MNLFGQVSLVRDAVVAVTTMDIIDFAKTTASIESDFLIHQIPLITMNLILQHKITLNSLFTFLEFSIFTKKRISTFMKVLKILKKELQVAYENMMRKQKIEIHLLNLERRIKAYEKEAARLLRLVDLEEENYHKLEKLNLRALFFKVLGTKEKELEKERQDYLMSFLKYQSSVKNLESLRFEKEVLTKQLSSLHNAEKIFNTKFAKKGNQLEANLSTKNKQKLKAVDLRLLNHEARIKELREAVKAGKKAETTLMRLIHDLSNITQWGNSNIVRRNDRIRGRGQHSSPTKRRFVNQSKKDAQKANILLEHFETEIQDIQKHFKIDYRNYIKSFEDFLDIFYDNLITDWIVKKNLKNSTFAIQTVHDKVSRIMAMLNKEIDKTKAFIKEENLIRKQIILESD